MDSEIECIKLLREVPAGRVFSYPGNKDKYFKLHNNKAIEPPPGLTELAAKFGEGRILHCNPESVVEMHK